MMRRPVYRYWGFAVAQVILMLVAVIPVVGQTINRGLFTARSTGGNQIECFFQARDNLTSQLTRRNFLSRPPGQGLTVAVMTGLVMTAQAIDNQMETASQFLQQDNGGTDVNCCVEIRRTGAVGNFAQPTGMIGGVVANATDLANVNAVGANVKIVSAINWCGQAGTYAGCRSGNSLVVTTGFAAATIAHEFGHMQGLCHVQGANGCVPTCGQAGACAGCTDASASNIMWFSLCAIAQDRITSGQCTSYRQGATP